MTGATTMTSSLFLALMALQAALVIGDTTVEMATTTDGAMDTTTAEPDMTTQASDAGGDNSVSDNQGGDGSGNDGESSMTTAAPPATVSVTLLFAGVSYDLLAGATDLLNAFETTCKNILAAAISGVSSEHIAVTVSPGSVQVDAVITVPDDVDASAVSSDINTAKEGNLADDLVTQLGAIEGIDAVLTGNMTATITVTTGSSSNTDTTTAAGGSSNDDSTEADGAWHAAGSISLAALAAAAVALA